MNKTTYIVVGEAVIRAGIFSTANEKTYQRLQPVSIEGKHSKLDIIGVWAKEYNKRGLYKPTMILQGVIIPKNFAEVWKDKCEETTEGEAPLED